MKPMMSQLDALMIKGSKPGVQTEGIHPLVALNQGRRCFSLCVGMKNLDDCFARVSYFIIATSPFPASMSRSTSDAKLGNLTYSQSPAYYVRVALKSIFLERIKSQGLFCADGILV